MQRYYKSVSDGYIVSIGIGLSGEEITQDEYNTILTIIKNKPERTDDTDYRLTTELTWEPYHVDPIPDVIDADEALNIIIGGGAE